MLVLVLGLGLELAMLAKVITHDLLDRKNSKYMSIDPLKFRTRCSQSRCEAEHTFSRVLDN